MTSPIEHREQKNSSDGADNGVTDFYVELFVRAVNEWGGKVSITVWVRGAIISGDLIGYTDFQKELRSLLNPSNNEQDFANLLSRVLELAQEEDTDGGTDQEQTLTSFLDHPAPKWIHLRNAQIISQGGRILEFPLWRGSLS